MESDISDADRVRESALAEIEQILYALRDDIRGRVDESDPMAGMKIEIFFKHAKEKTAAILNPGVEVLSFDRNGLQLTVPVAYAKNGDKIMGRFLINKKPPFGDLHVQFQMRMNDCLDERERDVDKFQWVTYTGKFPTGSADYDSSSALEEFLRMTLNGYKDKMEMTITPEEITESLKTALSVFERYDSLSK